jgi:hypothetical protein
MNLALAPLVLASIFPFAAARPEWKLRAKGEELLRPIQKSKEFEALVGK